MTISRRTMLRALGVLGAAQTFPLSACRKAKVGLGAPLPGPGTGPAVTVIFDGPWLFTRNGTNLVATTFGDLTLGLGTSPSPIPHTCTVAGWSTQTGSVGYPVATGSPTIYNVNKSAVWTGSLLNRTPTTGTFNSIFSSPACAPATKPVYFPNSQKVLTKLPTDRQVILPFPDSIGFGGQLINATVTDTSSGSPVNIGMKPCVATILQYLPPASGSLPTEIDFTASDGTLPSPLKVTTASPLLFSMFHNASFDSSGTLAHVIGSFQELLNRVGLSKFAMQATNSNADQTSLCGITAAQMGVAKFVPPGANTPFDLSMANCAGGGLGVDCS